MSFLLFINPNFTRIFTMNKSKINKMLPFDVNYLPVKDIMQNCCFCGTKCYLNDAKGYFLMQNHYFLVKNVTLMMQKWLVLIHSVISWWKKKTNKPHYLIHFLSVCFKLCQNLEKDSCFIYLKKNLCEGVP